MGQIYGRKVGMTRIFNDAGENVAVTVVEVTPNVVTQVKTVEKEGYSAVQVGFGEQKPQRVNKALSGHEKAAKRGVFQYLRELRFDAKGVTSSSAATYNVGDEITLEGQFEAGAKVDIIGTSIGKGFAGVMKRHHMKGNPMTRGTHEYRRHGGSIGCRKFPGRVFKNKRMAGHMGVERCVQEQSKVVAVRPQENLILILGGIPGKKNGVVLIRSAVKA